MFLIFEIGITAIFIMDKDKNIASLFAGANLGPNIHSNLAVTPATEESCHSPSLPDYIEDKKDRGVSKYIDTNSASSVTNDILRPADLWGEVINDAKPGMPYNWLAGLR